MPDLDNFDHSYEAELLEVSYDAIRNKDCLQIVSDADQKKAIHQKALGVLAIPHEAVFTFPNLFKMSMPNGTFHIAQSLFDFGYPVSRRLSQSLHKYHFQVIGIADVKIDLGKTLLRRETRTDKVVTRFFGNDIDFTGTEKFNDKYYLVSDKKDAITQTFDKNFVNTLVKYDDLVLMTNVNVMVITFESEMKEEHAAIIEEIFSHFNFLAG